MGKASRKQRRERPSGPVPAPFVARPFEGLPGETEWVAMREILPAATGTVRIAGAGTEVTVATVLPMAWPGMHRDTGERFVGLQTQGTSGDISRDLARAMTLVVDAAPGTPVTDLPVATLESPRLQDVIDPSTPFEAQLHDGFDFWFGESELDEEHAASLQAANESVIPTVRLESAPTVFWCEMGGRAYVRWVLPEAEDVATDGLARLHASGRADLGGEGARLLGAFRTSGLIVPVWEVDPEREPESFTEPVARSGEVLAELIARTEPLGIDERRSRAGLLNRQVTLR